MKRFIKNILLFGVCLLGMLIVEDVTTTYAFHRIVTRKYGVWNDIIHDNIKADLLIMGNSRAWCHYSPEILDSILGTESYNIGIDGSCFNRQLARYDMYRHYIPDAPKYIIQNVEFFTLGHTEGYEREQFMPYLVCPYFRERIGEIEPFSFGELYIPMCRYYVNNVYDEYTKYDFPVTRGYLGEEKDWDGTTLNTLEPFVQEVDTNTIRMFEEYIKNLQSENIRLVLVIAPIYKDGIDKVLNMDEIHSLYYDYSKTYNIPLLDYSRYWLSQDTAYFTDATHLNKVGSEIFSTQLANDIDSLRIIK